MPPGKVTALDVARKAGVSQPTVSRVFSSGSKVSVAMEARVRQAADQLGYRPNTLARSLITGQSRTIGLVMAYLENPFYPEALERLSHVLRERGYHVLIMFASNRDDEIDALVEDLLAHQVDGIILASVSTSNSLSRRLLDAGLPLVLFNRGQDDTTLSSVTAANFEGGGRAAEFLAAGGHSEIAHISGWQGSLNGRERKAGFLTGLTKAGLEPVECVDGEYDRARAQQATRHLVETYNKLDAIFVGNDHMAFAVIETLKHELGREPGQDISVVGYDDVAMASWPDYDLTTLRQPANRMVDKTVSLLMKMIDAPNGPVQRIEIDSPLIIRGSARVPPGWLSETTGRIAR